MGVYNKTNIPCRFLFNSDIIHPRLDNIQLRFASLNITYLGRIISDIKQKGIEYLLIISLLFKNKTHYDFYVTKFPEVVPLKVLLIIHFPNNLKE